MLSTVLNEIARDIEAGRDASSRLSKALKSNTKGATRAQKLELITRVLDHACKSRSEAIENAFSIALASLRDLTPFLKKKSASLTDTIAAVEKYAVNFALLSTSNSLQQSSTFNHEDELVTSIQRIFQSRAESQKTANIKKRPAQVKRSRRRGNKENEDPNTDTQVPTFLRDELLDLLFFPQASVLGVQMLLPGGDSADIATTISGALSIRLTRCCADLPLKDQLALAEQAVFPWLEHLRSFDNPRTEQTCSAYSKRVSSFLLIQCQSQQSDSATVLHTQIFALQLERPKLNQFARDVLQSANNFSRTRKEEGLIQNKHEVLANAYSCAMRYAANFDFSDRRWASEDVSAWLDDVALNVAEQRPKRPLPELFRSRLLALRENRFDNNLLDCYKLQIDLFEVGAYELGRGAHTKQVSKLCHPVLWRTIAIQLQNAQIGDLLNSKERASFLTQSEMTTESWRIIEADAYRCLRLMRVLEPIRKFIVTGFPRHELPEGAEMVLRKYLSVLLRGLHVLSICIADFDPSAESAVKGVLIRLNKMASGGLEAANNLLCWYVNQHLFDDFEDVATGTELILKYHGSYSSSSAQRWTEWLFSNMSSLNRKVAMGLKENKNDGKAVVMRLSEVILFSANQLLKHAEASNSVSSGYSNVLITMREGLLSHRLWSRAADVSLRLFEHVTSSRIEHRSPSFRKEVSRITAQDLVRLLQERKGPAFLKDVSTPAGKLLSLLTEYSFWTRKNRDSFKTHLKYLEAVDRLTVLRRGVFQFCDLTGLRCPARNAHDMWLSFTEKLSLQDKEKVLDKLEAREAEKCTGHVTLGMMDSTDHSCTPVHLEFLENLRKVCRAAALESVETLTNLLCVLEPSFPANKTLSRHVEISLLAMEVLQWISTVLAFRSFGILARRSLSMANEFGSLFDISVTDDEIDHACVLDSLPTLMPQRFHQDEDMCTSGQTTNLSSLHVSDVMHTAKLSLKRSLKALWKCKIGLNGQVPETYSVGGLLVDVSFNRNSFSGKHRLGLILELIDHLFRLGVLQSHIENMSEARYYMELCFRISESFLPPENNSLRRIAVTTAAKCATKKKSRPIVQESLRKQVPIENEELEHGRDIQSCYTTLHITADALLFIETNWKLGSETSSLHPDAHCEFIASIYARCLKLIALERENPSPIHNLETERARLEIGIGVTCLLRGEKMPACKLKSIIESEETVASEVRALASYELTRLRIDEAGGLKGFLPQTLQTSRLREERPLRRSTRRKACTKVTRRLGPPFEETKSLLVRALQNLTPRIENFQLCRKTWNMVAMIEHEPDLVAKKLAQSVGLSFNARYNWNTSGMKRENSNGAVHLLEKGIANMSLTHSHHTDHESDASILRRVTSSKNTVLVGVHMDENKSNIVIWRRCGFGFEVRRVWLPSSGPQSYDAILERMEAILHEVKQSSVKDGQEMAKAEKISWWEDRYRLDNQMKLLLTEIQESWLGSATSLFIPFICSDFEGAKEGCQRPVLSDYAALGARACDPSDDEVILGELVLLVDKPSERIPWESLPLLRDSLISVTRTPSLSFLSAMWAPGKCFDGNRLFYVLNPEGNLKRTESRFREKLESVETWVGTSGVTSGENVASLYKGEEIYLYCGHGAGEDFFSPSKICTRNRAPIALLMGCSSCRPRDIEIGDYESSGPAIEFLTHGSAAVVGNLWDVSDGEIDRLTSSVLSLWMGDRENDGNIEIETLSLADALARSRSKCRLPYLVGAACIVMGVPHVFTSQDLDGYCR